MQPQLETTYVVSSDGTIRPHYRDIRYDTIYRAITSSKLVKT